MIESESLDVRAVTMGVSLRDTASEDLERTCGRIYEKLMRVAERLVPTTTAVHADFAVPITIDAPVGDAAGAGHRGSRAPRIVPAALALERAARELGVDYVGGFSALVEKGITPGDRALIESIPEALARRARLLVGERGEHARRHQRRRGAGDGPGDQGGRRGDRGGRRHRLRAAGHVREHPRRQPVRGGRHARGRRGRVRDQRRLLGPGRGAVGAQAAARGGRAATTSRPSPRRSSAWRSRSRAPAS